MHFSHDRPLINMENDNELKKYGQFIISGNKQGLVDIPCFNFDFEKFLKIFDEIRISNDHELRVGFIYALQSKIAHEISNFSETQLKEILNLMLNFSQEINDSLEMDGMLKAIDFLCQKSNQWNDVIEFIVKVDDDKNDLLRFRLFDAMSFVNNYDIVHQNVNKLIPIIKKLLNANLCVNKSTLLFTFALCNTFVDEINENDVNLVWDVALDIASKDDFKKVYPALNEFHKFNSFNKVVPNSIRNVIDNFSIDNIDSLIPVLRLFCFLNGEAIHNLLQIVIKSLNEDFEKSSKIIYHLKECDLVLLDDDVITVIYELLKSENEKNELQNGVIALLSPFMELIISIFPEAEEEVVETITKGLKSDSITIPYICCKVLRDIYEFLEMDQQEMYQALISLLTSENENLLVEANKVAIQYAETSSYSTPEIENQIIALFPKYKPAHYHLFSKLIKTLLSSCDDPGLTMIEPAYELALKLLSTERTKGENSIALDIFSGISEIEPDFVEDQVVDGLNAAVNILKSEETELYYSAVLFLSAMGEQFQDQSKEIILQQLPLLTKIIYREIPINVKDYCKIATATSEILSEYDIRDIISDIIKYALKLLDEDEKISECGSQMIVTLSKSLLPVDAIECFTALTKKIDVIPYTDTVENLILAMKYILKKYRIQFISAQVIADKILIGTFKGIQPIDSLQDSETNIFGYLKAFVKKFKSKTVKYCEKLLTFVPIVNYDVLPLFLSPIEAAMDQKLFSEDVIIKFYNYIYDLLVKFSEHKEFVTSLLTCVISIKRSYPKIIDYPKLLTYLSNLWEDIDETDEDVELPMAISMLTLELCGESQTGEGVNVQLILDLFELLPLSPDVCDLQLIIQAVIKIIQKEWSKEYLLLPSILFLTKILLLKKNKLDEYQISPEMLPEVRKIVQSIIKSNPTFKEELLKKNGGNKSNNELIHSLSK